ncbi:MAG: 50S ribosomal protein L21 [Pantoea sp. Brub]|nr:50S ribosomal protein L21 [Pantoea sp. Brub]
MYAVFQSGGKQHKVTEGQTIRLEKIRADIGKCIELHQILMIVNKDQINIGTPFITGSLIKAEVISHIRGKKITIIKFRRRKHYRKQQGHRQYFTNVKILNIVNLNGVTNGS